MVNRGVAEKPVQPLRSLRPHVLAGVRQS